MKNRLTPFFATEADLRAVFDLIGSTRSFRFVAAGLFVSADVQSEPRLPKFSPTDTFLVTDSALDIQIRHVPQRNGVQKFAIDQTNNPKTIALWPGGFVSDTCLVAGQVGTVSEDPVSVEIYRAIAFEIRKQFTRIKAYYVSVEARQLLEDGVRLTANAKASPVYDLKS